MTQPTALRLADVLEMSSNHGMRREAAAELRRLYDLAMEQQGKFYALEMARSMERKTAKLKRDALLEALREAFRAFAFDDEGPVWADSTIAKARAAIKAAEENT